MGINARGAVHPRWTRFAAPTLRGFAWTKFRIIDPNTHTGDAHFEPWTNATGSDPVVMWEGWGQMQVFRQTLNAEIPAGGITQVRSLRFTVPHADIQALAGVIRKGLTLEVTEIKELGDEDVMGYLYTVTSGVGATLGWTRTIEAEVDVGVIS